MKIEVDIPDGELVGTARITEGAVIPPGEPPPGGGNPPPGGGGNPPTSGQATAPWGAVLPVQVLPAIAPYSGQHTFPAGMPSSKFITAVQITADFRNAGFSSPPPTLQGCYAAVGSFPGGSDIVGWQPGPDNANVMMYPAGGANKWLSMVVDPTHPDGGSYYSAN